jgi:hypothetical protein
MIEGSTVWTSRFFLLFGIIALGIGCGMDGRAPRYDLVLLGGHVIDVESGETLRDRDVWIVGDRIDSITPSGGRNPPRGTAVIDIQGRYVVPGLVDAHVHIDHVDELELYTAYGVTTVFNMRGLPQHLEWRDAIARGERDGPTIYTAGDYMDGHPPYMQPLMSFDNAEEAAASVREQASRELTPRVIEIEDAIKSDDLDAAREAFDQARALEPGVILFSQYVPFFIGYAYLYGEDGYSTNVENLEAALTLYRMYAETYPSFHSAHYMLALAREANGDLDGAIESLNASLAIHPYSPDARQKLAELKGPAGE